MSQKNWTDEEQELPELGDDYNELEVNPKQANIVAGEDGEEDDRDDDEDEGDDDEDEEDF